MCIEREKVDFKSREVNCLKECALALKYVGNMLCRFYSEIVFLFESSGHTGKKPYCILTSRVNDMKPLGSFLTHTSYFRNIKRYFENIYTSISVGKTFINIY